jgi:hypothetical protein
MARPDLTFRPLDGPLCGEGLAWVALVGGSLLAQVGALTLVRNGL